MCSVFSIKMCQVGFPRNCTCQEMTGTVVSIGIEQALHILVVCIVIVISRSVLQEVPALSQCARLGPDMPKYI